MSYKVKSNEVGSAVGSILDQYTVDIQAGVRELTDEYADKLKEQIKKGSPVDWRRVKRRGKYKRNWKVKTTSKGFAVYKRTVYSPKEYRLTHLLEFGHKTRKGTMTRAQAHIAPAAENIKRDYVKSISDIVRQSKHYGGGRRSYKR